MRILMKVFIVVVSLMIIGGCHFNSKKSSITITFVGDLLLDRGVRQRIEHLGADYLFQPGIDSLFSGSDVVIANLECPATKINEPINKKYIFRAEPYWLADLRRHGITHLNMANNHSMDQGRKGLVDTYNNIIAHDLVPIGYGANYSEACQPQLISSYPRKVFLLSSLLVPSENWTFLKDRPCVCEASINELSNTIKQLRLSNESAIIIVQLHWGIEHTIKPLISQKQNAYQLIDAGADCIIGHHTHTVQTIEYYRDKPIYYSIGNFIFDQSKPINKRGLVVKLKINDHEMTCTHHEFLIEKCSPHLLE